MGVYQKSLGRLLARYVHGVWRCTGSRSEGCYIVTWQAATSVPMQFGSQRNGPKLVRSQKSFNISLLARKLLVASHLWLDAPSSYPMVGFVGCRLEKLFRRSTPWYEALHHRTTRLFQVIKTHLHLDKMPFISLTCAQGCGAVTFLVGSGSGSGEAIRLRLRLRLQVKLFGDSGSGQMYRLRLRLRWSSPHMSLNQQYDFQNAKYQNMISYRLGREFECYFEWVSLKFVTCCHPRPLADIREVTDSFGLRCLRLVA